MKRGEIWMVDFGTPSGPEQAGTRPAIVVQDDALTQLYTTLIVVPLTTNLKRLDFPATVLLQADEGGLPQDSVALCYQVMVRGKARLLSKVGDLNAARPTQILDGILTASGL